VGMYNEHCTVSIIWRKNALPTGVCCESNTERNSSTFDINCHSHKGASFNGYLLSSPKVWITWFSGQTGKPTIIVFDYSMERWCADIPSICAYTSVVWTLMTFVTLRNGTVVHSANSNVHVNVYCVMFTVDMCVI